MRGPPPPLEPAEPCQTWSGVFFVRRCARPAVARCVRCGKAACQEHLRPVAAGAVAPAAPAFVCLGCLGPAVQRGSGDRRWNVGSEGGSSGSTGQGGWSGGGGRFSGAGASGRWDATAATTAAGAAAAGAAVGGLGAGADPVFTEADYAAFAAMSEADKDDGGSSYDS